MISGYDKDPHHQNTRIYADFRDLVEKVSKLEFTLSNCVSRIRSIEEFETYTKLSQMRKSVEELEDRVSRITEQRPDTVVDKVVVDKVEPKKKKKGFLRKMVSLPSIQ